MWQSHFKRHPCPLAAVSTKAVELDFDGGRLSSDAGVVLLKDIDDQLGLTRALAAVLSDPRDARRIHFTPKDCSNNACFKLPQAMKMLTTPTRSATMPSSNYCSIACLKPARLWRHNQRWHGLKTASHAPNYYRMALVLLEQFIASYARAPTVIVLDVDDTGDRVHGQQEHARYDGYYGGYCFLPLHLYEGL